MTTNIYKIYRTFLPVLDLSDTMKRKVHTAHTVEKVPMTERQLFAKDLSRKCFDHEKFTVS